MPGQDDNMLPGIDELMNTIRGINEGTVTDDDVPPDDNDQDQDTPPDDNQDQDPPEDDEDQDQDQDDDQSTDEDDQDDQDEPPTQTPEERKRFAAERRQREMQQQVEAEVQRRLNQTVTQSPEMQLARQLAEMYGTTPEVMLQQISEARLQEQAKQQQVPVEVLREQQRIKDENQQTRNELLKLQFQMWNQKTDQEGQALIKDFGLTQDEINQAKNYMLDTLGNINVPLKQAVLALHGDKILKAMNDKAETEALAKVSGRKQSALPPQGGKSPKSATATAEEQYIAQQLGMKVEDYLKYK